MRLLLDTGVWLWMIGASDRLSAVAKAHLADESNELYLSAAAVWEIGIKHAAGKLRFTGDPTTQIPLYITRSGVQPLSVRVEHVVRATALPAHHRDPFDRLMVAQALEDGLTLITGDGRLAAYEVPILDART